MALPPTVSASGVHVLPTVLRARQVLPRVRNKLARHRLRVIENFRPTRSKPCVPETERLRSGLSKSENRPPDLCTRMHVSSKRLRVLHQLVVVTDYY